MISLMVGSNQVRDLQSLLGLCLTGWKSPISMIILCGPGRFQLIDPLIYLLDRFHWRCRRGQLLRPSMNSVKATDSEESSANLGDSISQNSPSSGPLDLSRLLSTRCITTLESANLLDLIQIQALQNQSIKLLVLNKSTPNAKDLPVPGSAVFHVSSVKGTIDPLVFLPWLVDGIRYGYQPFQSNDTSTDSDCDDIPESDPYSPKSHLE